jgi:hypothetical protein
MDDADKYVIQRARPRPNLQRTLTFASFILNISTCCVVFRHILSGPSGFAIVIDALAVALPSIIANVSLSASPSVSSAAVLVPARLSSATPSAIVLFASPAFGYFGSLASSALVFLILSTSYSRLLWLGWNATLLTCVGIRRLLDRCRAITICQWDECLPVLG